MKQIFVLLSILVFCSSFSQSIDKAVTAKKIDSLFKFLDNNESPGGAVTVLQNNDVISKKSFGMANLENGISFRHNSAVRMVYSMGREFMSVGAAIMESEGLLRFDDKIYQYYPKLPPWSKDVTVLDLLNHASGFDDEWSLLLLMTADMRSQVETEQVLTLLYNQPQPQYEPGKGYMYNNTDYALLRLIMEKAAKQSLPDYLKRKLFEPLGMNATLMNDDVEMLIPNFADEYYGQPLKKGRFIKSSPGGNYRMVTTADDLEKWAAALDDESSLVAKGFKRLYEIARPIPTMSPEKHYTFGHEIRNVNGTDLVYHGGVGDSFYLVRIPSRKISVVGIGNSSGVINPTMELAQSFVPQAKKTNPKPRFFPVKPTPVKNEALTIYTGRYFAQQVGYNSHIPSIRFFDVKADDGKLTFYPDSNGPKFSIIPYGKGYFKLEDDGTMIQFSKSNHAGPMKIEAWNEKRSRTNSYVRAENNFKADLKYLKQFAGTYYSPHLDFYWKIALSDEGRLVIKRPTVSDVVIEPDSENRFLVEQKNGSYSVYMFATFSKDADGNVDGFTLRDSRMMHHRFDKVK